MVIGVCGNNVKHINTLRELLEDVLARSQTAATVLPFGNAFDFWGYLEESCGNFDLVYMDVNLHPDSGIDIVLQMHAEYPHIPVIFVGGNGEITPEIFDARPLYFLTIPIVLEKFQSSFQLALQAFEQSVSGFIPVVSGNTVHKIIANRLSYVMSDKRKVLFVEDDRTISVYAKLDDIEPLLPRHFLRCHKSYAVNMDRVKYFNRADLELFTGAVIPIAENRYKESKARYLAYLGLDAAET